LAPEPPQLFCATETQTSWLKFVLRAISC
jgi:hypothetical protein